METDLKQIVEALLFASERPLTEREICAWVPERSPLEIRLALEELLAEYDGMGRSFLLREVAHGFQFRTRPAFGPYVQRMRKGIAGRLSRASMETLAVIAYRQPVMRHEIEAVRGVDAGGVLRTLMEKGLIRISGRKDLPGRPLLYGTTNKFLEVFDLKDLASLPKLKEIRELGLDDPQKGEAGDLESLPLFGRQEKDKDEDTQDRKTRNPGS